MDDAGSGSLFAVVEYCAKDPPHYSIVQLDRDSEGGRLRVYEKLRFHQPEELSSMGWWFSGSKEDLYMVPAFDFAERPARKPLHGFKFNFRTGSFLPINRVPSISRERHVVDLRGDICFMAPYQYYGRPVFLRYDPDKDSWNGQNPVGDFLPCLSGEVVAIAVWEDTILLNIECEYFLAYDVSVDKWYPVEVEDEKCYDIVGDAVVLENTIYALTDGCCKSLLALSIVKTEIDDDHLVLKCSLLSHIVVADTEAIPFDDDYQDWMRSRHLVHLGKDNFCVVRCFGNNKDYQPIQVTYITRKSDNTMIATDNCVVTNTIIATEDTIQCEYFLVDCCFSLPKGATTALKQGKGTPLVLDCNPYVSEEDYAPEPDIDEYDW